MSTYTGPVSIQLWSTRGPAPLGTQLAALAAMGYTDVQPYHDQYDDPAAMRALLDRHGLTAVSGHFNLAMFAGDAAPVIDAARTLGMGLVVAPWLAPEDRPTEAAGWQALHLRLQRMKAAVEDAGLRFAWHNHDFEFQKLPCGSYGIEYLLADDIDLAMDVAWVAVGQQDPARWLRHYAGRVPAIHVKDIAPEGENLDQMGFTDLGRGTLDWTALWALADDLGIPLRVAEHDLPADWQHFARTAAEALIALRAGGNVHA